VIQIVVLWNNIIEYVKWRNELFVRFVYFKYFSVVEQQYSKNCQQFWSTNWSTDTGIPQALYPRITIKGVQKLSNKTPFLYQ